MNASVRGGCPPERPRRHWLDILRELIETLFTSGAARRLLGRVITYFETPQLSAGIDRQLSGDLRQLAEDGKLVWEHKQAIIDAAIEIETHLK